MTLPVPGDPSRGATTPEGGVGPVFTYPYATGDLVDALLALQAATRGVNPDWYEPIPAADMVACTRGDGFTVTALTRDGRMVGFAAVRPTRTVRPAAHVEGVVVLPEYRRLGVAAGLMCRVRDTVTTSGMAGVITATIHPDNEASAALFRAAGFEQVGTVPLFGTVRTVWETCPLVGGEDA